MRFLTAFCMGIGATVAWQSYGDTAREMIAGSYPQLGWLAQAAATTASTRSADPRQIQDLSLTLAAMRQRIDQLAVQLAAGQDQMTRDITAKMAVAQRDIVDRIGAATAARKPAPQSQLR
jgi:hypothetical protein